MNQAPPESPVAAKTPVHVLIFEDDVSDIEFSLRALRSAGFEVHADVAMTPEKFNACLHSRTYDVILSDYRMPCATGEEIYLAMKAEGMDIPFILVTGSLGEEKAVECLKQGIADYILKDRLVRLPLAVVRAIEDRRRVLQAKRDQGALERSEASFRSLVDRSPYGIFHATPVDGRFLDANPALVEMLGYESAADVLELDVTNDVCVDRGIWMRMLRERAREGRIWSTEVQWRRKDGSSIRVEVSGRPGQPGEAGDCLELIAIDVTARRLAEERIRQLNRLYSVSSHVSQAIVRFRNAGKLLLEVCKIIVEEGSLRMAWVGIADAETQRIEPVVHWGAEECYRQSVGASLPDGPAAHGLARSAIRDGAHAICQDTATDPGFAGLRAAGESCDYGSAGAFPLKSRSRTFGAMTLCACEPAYFDDENVALLDQLAADVSFALENLELAEQRQEAIDELNQFFTLSRDVLMISDLFGYIYRRNPAWERTLGFAPGEMVSERWTDSVHPEDQGVALAALARLQSGAEIEPLELRFLAKDGAYKWLVVSAVPVLERGAVFAAMRDISERKSLDEQLRRQNLALEEQNRRVHAANRLKSEFLANMSHELRSPLNGIIGFAELLHDGRVGAVPERQKDLLGRMLKSSKHLLRLINEVLDLSRIESGRLDLQPEKVCLTGLVQEVAGILSGLAVQKHIQLETSVHPEVEEVITDPARFKQVLYNYLSNALKFTEEGGQVCARILPQGEEEFRLEVADTGIGIPPSDIGRLFTEFQQLDGGKAKLFQGTGLGLVLTKRVVEAQGGTVGVQSMPGYGSTFHATLPRAPRSEENGVPRILVVEDEPVQTLVIKHFLQTAGCSVEAVVSGRAAVMKAREESFDAITLDLLLPDAPGWEVLEAIRSTEKNRRTPVIVLSIVEEGQMHAASHDVQAFLSKPVCLEDLMDALESVGIAMKVTKD